MEPGFKFKSLLIYQIRFIPENQSPGLRSRALKAAFSGSKAYPCGEVLERNSALQVGRKGPCEALGGGSMVWCVQLGTWSSGLLPLDSCFGLVT